MATFKIAPVNRIEGHMDCDCITDTCKIITEANNMVVMFRGLENIAVKRDPRDMPIISPRV